MKPSETQSSQSKQGHSPHTHRTSHSAELSSIDKRDISLARNIALNALNLGNGSNQTLCSKAPNLPYLIPSYHERPSYHEVNTPFIQPHCCTYPYCEQKFFRLEISILQNKVQQILNSLLHECNKSYTFAV